MLSPADHRTIFEASPDGCIVVDADGTIRDANPMIESLFGWRTEELIGKKIEVLIPEAARTAHEAHRLSYAENPHNRPMGVGLDLLAQRRDGTTFPVEVSLSPWRQESGELGVICAVRDVTTYRRLRNFSEGALRASEEERQRIARELHDDTAQRLATLILRVRRLAEERDHEARKDLFEKVRAEIVEAADGVKRMARGLRPPEIEELGLELAVRAHVRNLTDASDFRVELDLGAVDAHFDETTKLALYRIVQEALSNALRHAATDTAWVSMKREGDEIVTEVRDRGRGFTPAEVAAAKGGLGLAGMQERATMIGGRITVDSVPGEGTLVRVSVPITR